MIRDPAHRPTPRLGGFWTTEASPWAVRLFWFSVVFAALALTLWLATFFAGNPNAPMPSGTTTVQGNGAPAAPQPQDVPAPGF